MTYSHRDIKLSIITVNYNNAKGLLKTIESVVNQLYYNIEYIIIDGGSTDGSLDIIKKYENSITYWISEPDKGIYHAMNKGILKAKGEYLQFLNSGDWLVNELIFDNIFQDITSCDLIYGNMIMVMPNGKMRINYGTEGSEISFFTFFNGTITHPAAFIKRTLFFQYGLYDEQLRIVSDWKFYLVAFGLNRLTIEYRNIEVVYFDMNGISNVQVDISKAEREKVLDELIPYPILLDYKRNKSELDRLYFIRKHFITFKLNEIFQFFLVLLSKTLSKIGKFK